MNLFDNRRVMPAELVEESGPPAPLVQNSAQRFGLVVTRGNGIDAEVLDYLWDSAAEAEIQRAFYSEMWRGVELVVTEITIPLPPGTREIFRRAKS